MIRQMKSYRIGLISVNKNQCTKNRWFIEKVNLSILMVFFIRSGQIKSQPESIVVSRCGQLWSKSNIATIFGDWISAWSLEASQLFWFENILVSQMIYGVIWNFGFIAVIESCKGHVYQPTWQIASIIFAFRKVCSAFSTCSSCSNILEYKA